MSIFSNTVFNILNNHIPHEFKIGDARGTLWMTIKIKGTLMQILKSANVFFFIWK